MTRTEITALALAALAVAALAARADAPLSYAKDVEPVFLKECDDCHEGANPKKGLDLSKGKWYASLLQHRSQWEPLVQLVKPGDPAASYLWQKLTHVAKDGRGMPRTLFSARKLPQAELDTVRSWIEQGANP